MRNAEETYNKVSIYNDYTQRQRHLRKQLAEEAKRSQLADQSGHFLHRVRGTTRPDGQTDPNIKLRHECNRVNVYITQVVTDAQLNKYSPVEAAQEHHDNHNNVRYVDKSQTERKEKIICWYTNADTLSNKMAELRNRVDQAVSRPHIILVTEIKQKNARYCTTAAEISIPGYEMHSGLDNNEGRGTVIYIRHYMNSRMESMCTTYKVTTWIKLKTNQQNDVIVGLYVAAQIVIMLIMQSSEN